VANSQTTAQATSDYRNPLLDFVDRWEVDADIVRCRSCGRGQQTSWMNYDFPHAANCRNELAERNPWKTLASLLNALVSNARQP